MACGPCGPDEMTEVLLDISPFEAKLAGERGGGSRPSHERLQEVFAKHREWTVAANHFLTTAVRTH
jgi:hypothetical protein